MGSEPLKAVEVVTLWLSSTSFRFQMKPEVQNRSESEKGSHTQVPLACRLSSGRSLPVILLELL